MMRIAFLRCDDHQDLQSNVTHTFPSIKPKLLSYPNLQVTDYWACHRHFPSQIHRYDAYVITGSRSSVLDHTHTPWIQHLLQFIQKAYACNSTLIGICFGHQAIALALGGAVEKLNTPYFALANVTWQNASSHTQPMILPYFHEDHVQRMPPNSTLLATSTHDTNTCFSIHDRVLSMQFHADFSPKDVRTIVHTMPRFTHMPSAHKKAYAGPSDYQTAIDMIVGFIHTARTKKVLTQPTHMNTK